MTDVTKKSETIEYLPEFEHFAPLEALGGKYGISTDLIAKSIGGSKYTNVRQGLIAKIKDVDFYDSKLRECMDIRDGNGDYINDIVRTKEKGHRVAFLTKEPAIILVREYTTQGENRGKNILYAKYLSDERAFKESEERRLKKEKEEAEALEAKIKEETPVVEVEAKPEEPPSQASEIRKLKEEIDALKVIAKRVDFLNTQVLALESTIKAQKASYEALSKRMTKEEEEFVRRKLNNTAHHIARTIGCHLTGDDPYAPVRDRLLEYVSSYLFTPCTQFGWQKLTKVQASMMLLILKNYEEKGVFGSEEENDEMRDAVVAHIKRRDARNTAAFQDKSKNFTLHS